MWSAHFYQIVSTTRGETARAGRSLTVYVKAWDTAQGWVDALSRFAKKTQTHTKSLKPSAKQTIFGAFIRYDFRLERGQGAANAPSRTAEGSRPPL